MFFPSGRLYAIITIPYIYVVSDSSQDAVHIPLHSLLSLSIYMSKTPAHSKGVRGFHHSMWSSPTRIIFGLGRGQAKTEQEIVISVTDKGRLGFHFGMHFIYLFLNIPSVFPNSSTHIKNVRTS